MAGSANQGQDVSFVHFIIYRLLPGIILLLAAIVILFASYITSQHATAKISAILSGMLEVPVSISEIRLQGDALIFNGVTVGNPSGFLNKNFVSIVTIRLAAGWSGLLKGRRNLRILDVNGAKIDISKGNDGVWNFEKINKRLSGGKGGKELFIDNLLLTNSDILVNGKGVRRVSLKLRNVATKGSADSKVNLSFDDESGNRYTVTGSFRNGLTPDAEFSLDAPSLNLAGITGGNKQIAFSGGIGELHVKTILHQGFLRSSVAANLKDAVAKTTGGTEVPLTGSLQSSVTYDIKQDMLNIEHMSFTLDKTLNMRIKGNVNSLKSGLRYDLVMGINNLAIASGAELLPGLRKYYNKVSGTISTEKIRITGSMKHGVADIDGMVSLRDLLLAGNEKLLISGIDTDVKISTIKDSFHIFGELTQKKTRETPLIERIKVPYKVIISNRMILKAVDLSGFHARISGLPLSGNFAIRPEKRAPFSLSLKIPKSMLTAVSYGDNLIETGSAAMSLELSGASTSQFKGSAALVLNTLNGRVKGEAFSIGSSTINTDFRAASGNYSASGNASFARGFFRGVAAGGSFDFSAADNTLSLSNGTMGVKDSTLSFARIIAVLPKIDIKQPYKLYPLDVDLTGGVLSRGDLNLAGISASWRGEYAVTETAKWLAGDGTIAAEKLLWHKKNIGAPRADISLSRSGGKTILAGTVLGGKLEGRFTFKPNTVAAGIDFDISLKETDLTDMAQLIKKNGAVAVSGGKLTISTKGRYSGKDGVTCLVQGQGAKIALSVAGGKKLLANGGLKFDASLTQGNVRLEDAFFRIGEGAAVKLKGTLDKVFSSERSGRVLYSLDRTPLGRIVDPLINGLPRFLQEATVSGDITVGGVIELGNGRTRLQGHVELDNAAIKAESAKFQVENVSGEIPFSLGFPVRLNPTPEHSAVLKREAYDRQLALFAKATTNGSLLKIGKISFGQLDFKDTTLRIKAADGIIETLSLKSSLMTGKIFGQGYVTLSDKMSYGGDLLLNDLSLQQLCSLFPGIKGYVSGRMDGIAMFEGRGSGIEGLNGYTYLWTRQGDSEKMLVSREFLQKLAGKNLQGFFFRDDRPFDKGEAMASIESGYLTFDILDISNTNLFGVRDLKVTVTETQNRIALKHLMDSISQAVSRSKNIPGKESTEPAPSFKWDE